MTTIVPPKPTIEAIIHHPSKFTNPDKLQAMYYAHVLPYDEEKYIKGKYYYQQTDNAVISHIARIEGVNRFTFNAIPNTVSLIVSGLSKSILQHQLIAQYGADIQEKELGFYVFLNWDKFCYNEFICKPFATESK